MVRFYAQDDIVEVRTDIQLKIKKSVMNRSFYVRDKNYGLIDHSG